MSDRDVATMPSLASSKKRLTRLKSIDIGQFSLATRGENEGHDRATFGELDVSHKRLSRTDSSLLVVVDDDGAKDVVRISTDIKSTMIPNITIPTCPAESDKPKQKDTEKSAFSYIVRKHFNSLRRSSLKNKKERKDAVECVKSEGGCANASYSCPNLVKQTIDAPPIRPVIKERVRASKSSEGFLDKREARLRRTHLQRSLDVASPPFLNVPDIFTTSQTRSLSPGSSSSRGHSPPGFATFVSPYRHSAPELAAECKEEEEGVCDKPSLIKSLSDTPPRIAGSAGSTRSRRYSSSSSSSSSMQTESDVASPRTFALTNYLYMGNLEAAYCERVLCKLDIGSILDLSGLDPDQVPSHRKNPIPCMCGLQTSHPRAVLRLPLYKAGPQELESCLEQINKFIEGARLAGKRVLVFSERGSGHSEVAVMQYLMRNRQINLRKAYSLLMRHRADIVVTPAHRELLQRIEKEHIAPNDQSLCFDPAVSDANHLLPMQAWSANESSDI